MRAFRVNRRVLLLDTSLAASGGFTLAEEVIGEPAKIEVKSVSPLAYAGSRTNSVFDAPAGIKEGNILLAVHFVGASSLPSVTPPSGFVGVSGNPFSISTTEPFNWACRIFLKKANEADESVSTYQLSHSAAESQGYMACLKYADLDQALASIQVQTATKAQNSGSGKTITVPSVTPERDGAYIGWAAVLRDGANGTPPSGFIERHDQGAGSIGYYADMIQETAGATGTKTNGAFMQGDNDPILGIMFVIEPSTVPPTPFAPEQITAAVLTGNPYVEGAVSTDDGLVDGFPAPEITGRRWEYSTDGTGSEDGVVSSETEPSISSINENQEDQYIRSRTEWGNTHGSIHVYSTWWGPIGGAEDFQWPNATNVGVLPGVPRTTYTGSLNITTNGAVLQNLDIDGTLDIKADNVQIKNCRIQYNGWWGVDASFGFSGLFMENCDVIGPGDVGGGAGIAPSDGAIIKDCKISGTENGIFFNGDNLQILHNYIFDMAAIGVDPHVDCIQTGGCANVLIQDNTLVGFDTAHVILKTDFGGISNVTVDHNLMLSDPVHGAVGTNVYSINGESNVGAPTGTVITDNIVQPGWASIFDVQGSVTISGNFEYDPNAPDFKGDPV